MNLNIERPQNSWIIKIQKSAIPVANPHMLCQILFQNWHIFHQFTKSFAHIFYFYFEFFFATFSFLLTWQNILRNLKNGIESTFLPYYYHSSPIVLVIWHILKFWKKSWNDTKDFEIFKCKSLSSTMPPIKNEKNKTKRSLRGHTITQTI